MSNKLISDNILVVVETLHYLKNKHKGKIGFIALKLDMSKAYDRVKWIFLEKLVERMGFNGKWITLISAYIRSMSYSILVNGEPCGQIHPTRGLHQGDPLSPFLFLLCVEGLYSLLQEAESNIVIQGVSICQQGPKVSHFFFCR